VVPGELLRDLVVDAGLAGRRPDRDRAEIGHCLGQVRPRLLVDLRHRLESRPVFREFAIVERRFEPEQRPEARHGWPGAALGHQVEGRVPRPGPGHPVVEVEAGPGVKFNPDHHQAVSMVASEDIPPDHIISVMQKGFLLKDRLLRPAMVVVAS